MGLFNKAKKLAKDNVDKIDDLKEQHGDKIVDGIDKATDMIDDKTGGKLRGKLDKVDDAARKALDSD